MRSNSIKGYLSLGEEMESKLIRQIEALQAAHDVLLMDQRHNHKRAHILTITALNEGGNLIKMIDEIKQTLNKILTLPELQQFKYLPIKTDIENLMRRI